MEDLYDVSLYSRDENWPKSPFPEVNKRVGRRLAEATDRWKAEEEEMKQEFLKKVSSEGARLPSQKQALEPNMKESKNNFANSHHQIDTKREMQLPPISKTCTNPNDPVVGCPPPNIAQICDKYNGGSMEQCFQTCKTSVCCTHDSKSKSLSVSCADTAVNCVHWIPCYIAWWKLSDTIGPATFLRLEQDDNFFDINIVYVKDELNDANKAPFYEKWFRRFVDDDDGDLDDENFQEENLWVAYQNQ